MARVAALVPDLLFGSKVKGVLEQAGHEVDLVASDVEAWDEVGGLAAEDVDGVGLVETLGAGGELRGVRTLATYSHVDAETRERAQRAGFDVVVPRSRMMREGGALVARLLDGG